MSAETAAALAPELESPSPEAQLPHETPDPASDTTAESAPQPTDDKESKRVLSGVQRRIDELTRARHDAERTAAEQVAQWQRHAWELDQKLQQVTMASSEPTLENSGNDFEKFMARRAQWEAQRIVQGAMQQQGAAQAQAMQAQQAQVAAQQQALAEQQFVASKVAEGQKVYKDFAESISNPDLPPLRQVNFPAYQAILESEKGIDVAYYLSKNPLIAHKIAMANPVSAVREIGKIEAMFASGKRVSGAPAPVSTVGSNSSAGGTPDRMSMDEWVARREKQLKQRR